MLEGVLVQQVCLVEEEDGVGALLGALLHVARDGVEEAASGGGGREAERNAELAVEVTATEPRWSLDANRALDLPRALDRFAFRTPGLGRIAWDLGNTYLKPGFRRGNSSILYWFYSATFAEMRRSWLPRIKYGPEVFLDDTAVRRGMHETIEWIDAAAAPLSRIDDELLRRAFLHAGAMARHGARRVLGGDGLHAELDALVDELVALWPRRNRPGGMLDSVGKLRASRAFL